ncbi:SRPBCC family protein [Luteimicrobium sp. DT211]|uniref:SRPBCC family protein n=1 Tax=Luteimicrobium sp. DT211 TaxID=3393412 RepID=UPI003CF3B47E
MVRPIEIEVSVDVDVPAEHAWRVVANYRYDAAWRVGVETMTQEQPVPTPRAADHTAADHGTVTNDTRTVERYRILGTRRVNVARIFDVDPGRSFAWRTVSGTDAEGTRTVVPLGPERCRVVLRTVSRPRGLETILRPLVAPTLRRTLTASTVRLSDLLLTREPAGQPDA